MAAPSKIRKNVSQSLDKVERTLSSSVVFVVIIIFTALLFAVDLFLTYLAGNPNISKGLFIRGISEVSALYPLNITPAGFTFSIWGVIYLLQIGWILYSLGLLCRTTEDGPAYLHPVVLGPSFFLYFTVSTGAVIAWLFAWDRLFFLAAFVFLALVATCLVVAVFSAALSLNRYRAELIDQGRSLDVKIINVTVINGVSMYATWTTVATLINLGIILVYKVNSPLTNETASIVCLSILAVFVGLYSVLDAWCLKEYTNYNFAPYLTIVWALIGVLSENLDVGRKSSLISIALLVVTSLVLVVKAIFAVLQFGKGQYEYKKMKFGRCVTPKLEELKQNKC